MYEDGLILFSVLGEGNAEKFPQIKPVSFDYGRKRTNSKHQNTIIYEWSLFYNQEFTLFGIRNGTIYK